ncbi:MAG: alpha/beta hydrolase [Lachnospiraceae bacterium]
MAVMRFSHMSKVMMTLSECNIVLPDEVVRSMADGSYSGDKLKVLWLCHGGSSDHYEWLYHTGLVDIVNQYGLAAVAVNGNDSCFVDMPYGMKYGTYLGEELPALIHNTFPFLSDKREDNYICGLSNGGYGSFYLGLKFPHNFSAIGAFSAGDKADAVPKPFPDGEMNPRVRMFGQTDIHETEFSIRYLARELAKTDTVRPKVYHACGGKDPWLDLNLLVKKCFEEINDPQYAYVYHQIDEMGHEWTFWEQELKLFIENII